MIYVCLSEKYNVSQFHQRQSTSVHPDLCLLKTLLCVLHGYYVRNAGGD